MPNNQMSIEPESSDFYRPTTRPKRSGRIVSLVIKLSGGKMGEEGANYFLLGFAVIAFVTSIIILVITF